jgi:hypothetical protein
MENDRLVEYFEQFENFNDDVQSNVLFSDYLIDGQ